MGNKTAAIHSNGELLHMPRLQLILNGDGKINMREVQMHWCNRKQWPL